MTTSHSKRTDTDTTNIMKMLNLRTTSPGAPDGHSDRVALYVKAIGKNLDLSGSTLKDLNSAAVLHDIGKVGISKQIVDKLGRLSDREFEIMRLHSTVAIRMLERVEGLEGALPMIKHHHERYDGKGYPDGLKGTDIPIGARIIAVAETFDILTSNVPWRESLSQEEAVDEIKKNSGTQFDPNVVEAFVRAIENNDLSVSGNSASLGIGKPRSTFRIKQ